MKVDKFKAIESIRQFIIVSNNYLQNFPKKQYELKSTIERNSMEILEISYYVNGCEDVVTKIDRLNYLLSKIKVIDFLLDFSQEKGYINSKHYLKLCMRLGDTQKFCIGWLENIKKYNEAEKK